MLFLEGSEEHVNNFDSSSFKSKIFAMMTVGGQPVRFQVDSGATCNVISKNILPKQCQVTPCLQVLNMFNGSKMQTIGKCRVPLLNPKLNEEHKADLVVINEACTPLLGPKTVQQMKLVEVHYENIASVQKETEARGLTMDQISTQFHDVFKGKED